MSIIKRFWELPALIAIGLAMPTGVSNKFLPGTLTSSIYDEERVYIPIVSFQTLLLAFYLFRHRQYLKLTSRQLLIAAGLFISTIVVAYISLYPDGFLTYSTTWLVAPLAAILHLKLAPQEEEYPFARTAGMIAYLFLPFYVVDIAISYATFGLEEFTSYTLATNGHTFVSMLLVLFIQFDLITRKSKFKIGSIEVMALGIYIAGGILSQGRVALTFMIFATIALHWKKAKIFLPAGLLGLATFIYFNEKIRLTVEALIAADFDDPVAWSSLISRLNFWDVFFDIFSKYPIAGAGGLSANIIKYDHDFPYSVFVDPHNEYIFLLSGFGLSGIAFIALSIALVRSFYSNSVTTGQRPKLRRPIAWITLCFISLCSLTNANSAKQNIELLLCMAILLAAAPETKEKSKRYSSAPNRKSSERPMQVASTD